MQRYFWSNTHWYGPRCRRLAMWSDNLEAHREGSFFLGSAGGNNVQSFAKCEGPERLAALGL